MRAVKWVSIVTTTVGRSEYKNILTSSEAVYLGVDNYEYKYTYFFSMYMLYIYIWKNIYISNKKNNQTYF